MDALEAIGEPELRATLLHVRARPRPVTADEIARALAVHRNVARSRLERLSRAGLLTASYERRTGRSGPGAGRPAKIYAVSPELRTLEFPSHRYESLIRLLLDTIPVRGRKRKLRQVGETFAGEVAAESGLEPARTAEEGFRQVCAAVGRLGFQASLERCAAGEAVIVTPTCPLRPVVLSAPEAAEADRGMWAGLVAAAVPGARLGHVSCETSDCLDGAASCRVRIEF